MATKKAFEFSPTALKAIRSPIEEALLALGKKHGLTFQLGKGKYDANSATFQLNLANTVVGDDGEVKSPRIVKAEADWIRNAVYLGLKGSELGKTLILHGEKFKIVGLMPTRRKFPILLQKSSAASELKLVTVEFVRSYFANKAKAKA